MMLSTLFKPTCLCAALLLMSSAAAQAAQSTHTPGQYDLGNGLTFSANYTGEAAANTTGGLRQGSAYAGQLFLGADLDLQKMLGWNATSVHIAVTQRHGQSLSNEAIGNNTSVQEIYGTQNLHLAYFTVEKKFFGGRLEIQGGRTVANIDFLNSPLYCNFQSNSACGNPTFVFKNSNFTYFPASSWGGYAKGWVTDRLYTKVGAYEVNPNDKRPNDHGIDWSTKDATGVVVPWAMGYATTFANDTHPRDYEIGGWFDRSKYTDPLLDANGDYAVLTGQPYRTDRNRSGAYVRFSQMVWRPDTNSQRGLTLFGVAMTNLTGRVNESSFLELGAVMQGPFPGREQDTLGFVINQQRFSSLALQNIRVARASVGASTDIPGSETMMELAYGYQLSPGIRLSPNLQYILHPDQQAEPFRTSNIPNAFVIGLKFTVAL